MQKPFFSIIVVSLNAGKEVKNTLDSILGQTYSDYEIILKDGGSTDESIVNLDKEEYFERNSCIKLITKKDKGIYDAMNQAVEEARGEYLIFLNCGDYFFDDQVLEKTAIKMKEAVVSKLSQKEVEEGKNTQIFYGNQWNRKQNTSVISSPQIGKFTLYRNVPCHQVCFYHRDLFSERGYDLTYKVRADYEHFLYSVIKKNAECYYLDEMIASYEGGGYSETKENKIISGKEHKEVTNKYLGKGLCFVYRFILILTLAPLRSKINENPRLSAGYNRIKGLIYRRKIK